MDSVHEPGSPRHLAQLHPETGESLRAFRSESDAAAAITATAVELTPGADLAGITRVDRSGRLTTTGPSAPLVDRIDAIQYELGSGPGVEVPAAARRGPRGRRAVAGVRPAGG